MPATLVNEDNVRTAAHFPDRKVDSVCPYCGVGCQLTYNIKDDKLLYVTGKEGPANQNRLCVKGRFGFDYVSESAAPDAADGAQGRRAESAPTIWSIPRTRGRISAPPPGKRRWSAPPPAS